MLHKDNCGLIVIDMQGTLARSVHNSRVVIDNTATLIQCCQLLDMPIIWLEQYPQGLGDTVHELSQLLMGTPCYEKIHFNGVAEPDIANAVAATGKKQWLVAGIEAHICVYQTVVGLLDKHYQVEVLSDAISSRLASNVELARIKMMAIGAGMSCVEMAVYELLQKADSEEFKKILPLVK